MMLSSPVLVLPRLHVTLSKGSVCDELVIQTTTPRIITNEEPVAPILSLLSRGFKILKTDTLQEETVVTGFGDLEIVHFVSLDTINDHQRPYGNTTAGQVLVWKAEEVILSLLERYGVYAFRRVNDSLNGGCFVLTMGGVKCVASIKLSYMEYHGTIYARIVTLFRVNDDENRSLSDEKTITMQKLVHTTHDHETIAHELVQEYKSAYGY